MYVCVCTQLCVPVGTEDRKGCLSLSAEASGMLHGGWIQTNRHVAALWMALPISPSPRLLQLHIFLLCSGFPFYFPFLAQQPTSTSTIREIHTQPFGGVLQECDITKSPYKVIGFFRALSCHLCVLHPPLPLPPITPQLALSPKQPCCCCHVT